MLWCFSLRGLWELLFFIGDIILHEEQGRDFAGDFAGSIHRAPIGKHDHRDEFARCDPRFFGLALSALACPLDFLARDLDIFAALLLEHGLRG